MLHVILFGGEPHRLPVGGIDSNLPFFVLLHIFFTSLVVYCFYVLRMHFEDFVFRPAFTALTGMPVLPSFIHTYIPEADLFPLAASVTFDIRMFELLDIK